MSWVVGRGCGCGCGSWVWVNVLIKENKKRKTKQKKALSKEIRIRKLNSEKVVKFVKQESTHAYQSYSSFPRSAKQISESFSTNGL